MIVTFGILNIEQVFCVEGKVFMRYRAFRVTVATVSDALIDEYKKITGATDKREVIIKRVIEEKILFRKLTCKEDVAELKEIALGQFYNLPGEMISYFLRKSN